MDSHIYDISILEILLIDHSRPKNGRKFSHIIWATDNYATIGQDYQEDKQITVAAISGKNENLIQPRVRKTKEEQQSRSRDKGEVFTPSWICNNQNNLIDKEWFGQTGIFNEETDKGWKTSPSPITFPTKDGKTWQDYVLDIRLEITCGEAPYLISRYDTITGNIIPVADRIGLLDRKLRVVAENTITLEEWFEWAVKAYQATYGFEWQGDNLFLARQNALSIFYDYHQAKFGTIPSPEHLKQIAEIISWNFWQMDGLKVVIPNSCEEKVTKEYTLLGDEIETVEKCKGCESNDIYKHNGVYCKIKDWKSRKTIRFIDLLNK